ncbi:MAG: phosphotriesterase-related protein [Thermoanaerobacteraceae bacterium]|nr:phosphotriesterase-related protein [Thermoanaerobacteraceae bacterium]
METVLGKTEKFGRTLMHEHLTINLSKEKDDADANLSDDEAMIEDLKALKAAGIDTICDVTNVGMGRDVGRMAMIAEKSGVNVLPSTGFYKDPYFPEIVYKSTEKELATFIMKEIVEGIDGSGIRAAIIGEIGTSRDGFADGEKKVFLAAARAHAETGAPITTHTTLGKYGLEQVELLKSSGVDMERLVIGHLDLNPDMDYYLRILEKGCYIGFDTIGKNKYQPDSTRADCLYQLVRKGYGERIVLSLDITRKSHLKKYGGYGHSYIAESFIPMLLDKGISQKDIDMMLIENPKRLFEGR